jgi:hypothetical protein
MFTTQHVEDTLEEARSALAVLAEAMTDQKEPRDDVYARAQAEHDVLVCLLDEAPESGHSRIHDLLDRYEKMMRAMVS